MLKNNFMYGWVTITGIVLKGSGMCWHGICITVHKCIDVTMHKIHGNVLKLHVWKDKKWWPGLARSLILEDRGHMFHNQLLTHLPFLVSSTGCWCYCCWNFTDSLAQMEHLSSAFGDFIMETGCQLKCCNILVLINGPVRNDLPCLPLNRNCCCFCLFV